MVGYSFAWYETSFSGRGGAGATGGSAVGLPSMPSHRGPQIDDVGVVDDGDAAPHVDDAARVIGQAAQSLADAHRVCGRPVGQTGREPGGTTSPTAHLE